MLILGIDAGTTHIKAGLFRGDGGAVRIARRPTPVQWEDGTPRIEPDALRRTVLDVLREAAAGAPEPVRAIGIASMAETGMLVDRKTLAPRTPLLPWFDLGFMAQADRMARAEPPLYRFRKTGWRANPKAGLAKILGLTQETPGITRGACWLSTADAILFWLTGALATDYTLAARTFAFRIDNLEWDAEWVQKFGLSPDLFPKALPSGTPAGELCPEAAGGTGLAPGILVAVSGHDHICAALAAGAIDPGTVMDSVGTAEALVATLPARPLTEEDAASGLTFGRHVVEDRMFWMGGLQSSGASVEWLRRLLSEKALSYEELAALAKEAGEGPTGIVFFPYLRGAGAPWTDPRLRAAFVGLDERHGRAEIAKAALEGTAFEVEAMRRAGEKAGGEIRSVRAVGGGTRNETWLSIKADVLGCPIEVPNLPEATALGAAMAAAIGYGLYRDASDAVRAVRSGYAPTVYQPDPGRHAAYKRLFEEGFLSLQAPLRAYHDREGKTTRPT